MLFDGLEQEYERLEALEMEDRLGVSATASSDEVKQAYDALIINYLPKNYAKHDRSLVERAESVVELLEEAKNELLGLTEPEADGLNSELAQMAFAATQISDDIYPSAEMSEVGNVPQGRIEAPVSAVLPPQSSAPPPHFSHPQTPSYGFGSQDLPPASNYVAQAPARPPAYATAPAPYSPANYPPPPSWDIPPMPAAPNYPPAPSNIPRTSAPPPGGHIPRTGDLPPVPNQDPRVRELSHRLYSAESRMRVMERTHQERLTLIESQLAAAEYRAQEAERRVAHLEAALQNQTQPPHTVPARPLSPTR